MWVVRVEGQEGAFGLGRRVLDGCRGFRVTQASTRAPGREPTGAVESPRLAGWFGVGSN